MWWLRLALTQIKDCDRVKAFEVKGPDSRPRGITRFGRGRANSSLDATFSAPPSPMSAIDRLKTVIYHEKQQEGSMLCAQHALNSLLREKPHFTRSMHSSDSAAYRRTICATRINSLA